LGKILYCSRLFVPVRLLIAAVCIFLFMNIFFQTKGDPGFIATGGGGIQEMIMFHLKHPQEIITYLFLFVFPSIYYGFIRCNRFYEKGVMVNKGLPFFNEFIPYENIGSYQVVHTKYLLSLYKKGTGEEYLFTVKDIERILAILDQNHIEGKLKQEMNLSHFYGQKKFVYAIVLAGVVTFLVQYFNLAYYFWRTKWW
jgi:hypothetical protein